MARKTSLYRYFSEADELLYVGIAINPATRLGQHKRDRDITEVRHIEIEWFDSRSEASAAEAWAIVRERPKWNKVGVRRKRVLKRTPAKVVMPKTTPEPAPLPPIQGDGIWLDEWAAIIGPPSPYLFIAFSTGVVPDHVNEWRIINPSKAKQIVKYIRPGDVIWFEGSAPIWFWPEVADRRGYRWPDYWVRDQVRKATGSAARTVE